MRQSRMQRVVQHRRVATDDNSHWSRRGSRRHVPAFGDIEASLAGLRAHGGELENYENSCWLCYVRGPAGIIVELAGKIV
jgi:hypothetical protein